MQAIGSLLELETAMERSGTTAGSLLHDPMTGLYNKIGFTQEGDRRLPQMLSAGRHPQVLFMQLRNYEGLMSRLDFANALDLLKAVRRRLELAFGPETLLARFDSERFAALIQYGEDDLSALHRVLETPVVIGQASFHLSVTCGVARYPEAADCMDMLIMAARIARHDAVRAGRQIGIFATDLRDRLARNRAIEDGLWACRGGEGMSLAYQPKINIHTGKVTGVEALLRWEHPDLGRLSPAEFIPVAEETRTIVPISEWLIREALNQQAQWRHRGQDIDMAINISPVQLRPEACEVPIYDILVDECARLDICHSRVELEITEGMLMDEVAMQEIRRIKAAGFSIALDDFGRDYSALSVLADCPITTLKIDKAFVDNILHNDRQAAVIRFIAELAHHLGMRTVVEGIEHVRQLVAVAAAGCDYAQGYFYYRPLAAERILSLRHTH